MTLPFDRHFEAHLPLVATAVRITSLYDAQVFMRRWVIRDKDRNLKGLLRRLERANSAARIATAMEEFRRAWRRTRCCQRMPGRPGCRRRRLRSATPRKTARKGHEREKTRPVPKSI